MGFKGITVNTEAEAEPHILAEDDAAIYQGIFGQDGVLNLGSKVKATVISNNQVRVADGVIVVNGHVGRNAYADYADMTIENGTSGKKRNDLIVVSFSTTGSGGIDTYTLKVKKGTAGTTATDPALTQQDIYAGGKLREYPLYRVKLDGLSITAVEQMFAVIPTIPEMLAKYNELNSAMTKISGESRGNYYLKENIRFLQKSGIVHARLTTETAVNIEPNITHTLAYIPSGFEPQMNIPVPCMFNGFCKGIIFLTTNGDVQVITTENISAGTYIRFNTCYIK